MRGDMVKKFCTGSADHSGLYRSVWSLLEQILVPRCKTLLRLISKRMQRPFLVPNDEILRFLHPCLLAVPLSITFGVELQSELHNRVCQVLSHVIQNFRLSSRRLPISRIWVLGCGYLLWYDRHTCHSSSRQPMGSISPCVRKQEVTRKVLASRPDAVSRARSATANQKQTVTWDGPSKRYLAIPCMMWKAQRIGGWTEYIQMTVETS